MSSRHSDTRAADVRPQLHEFLRAHLSEIVAAWTDRIRVLSPAKDASTLALVDHLPEILASIAEVVAAKREGEPARMGTAPHIHALDRLDRGFELGDVVDEYAILRLCIFDLWKAERPEDSVRVEEIEQIERLHLAIDHAIASAAARFADARQRMLEALDRITEVARGRDDLDSFLGQLLRATCTLTEAIDAALLLLVEGGTLRVRASVGIDGDLFQTIGTRIADTIATTRQPLSVRDAGLDPLVATPEIREAGLRALYGVPLTDGNEVIGVAVIASRTAAEFSEEGKLLFRAMASRAAGLIVQARQRSEHERIAGERTELLQREQRARDEAQRTARELAEAEARVRVAVEATSLGTWDVDLVSGETRWSARTKAIYGLAADRDPQADLPRACIVDDDRAAVDEALASARDPTGEGRFEVEHRIRRCSDGAERWVATRGRVLFDDRRTPIRVVGTTLDITKRKRAEEAERFIAETTRLLSASLDYPRTLEQIAHLSVPRLADWCAVDVVNAEGGIDRVAVAHTDPAKIELAHTLRERYPPDPDAPFGVPAVMRTRRPELVRQIDPEMLARATRDDEHLRIVRQLGIQSYMIVPMIARDKLLGTISLVAAESGLRYDEQDLAFAQEVARRAALAVDNARLYEQAREATRLREQVLAIVSHDLRNPLSVIQMGSDALAHKSSDDPSVQRQVQAIQRSAARMSRLIADLQDLASIQAGRLAVDLCDAPAGPIIDEIMAVYGPLAAEHGLSLTMRADSQSLGTVDLVADHARVLQVFGNVLGNAIKFCSPGGAIVVSAERHPGEVRFAIRDTGPGIAADELVHIFEPYWSAQRHTRRGTGLGLYISSAIVRAHGGRMWAQSEPGRGSTFFFTIPTRQGRSDQIDTRPHA